jgi:NADPH:quinone reductase-like Zn-dependent oxidoreductase
MVLSQSLLLTAPRQLKWYTEELPVPQPHEVLVQTLAGAISVGAELPQFLGTARSSLPNQYPRMTGYESIGRVVACGTAVQRLHIGDRVVGFYGHRTFALLPEAKAILVPDGLSDAMALLLILSCDAAKGIRKLAIQANTPVLVIGAGTMGLLTTFVLKNYDLGYLMAETKRHTPGLAELTNQEAQALGLLVTRLSRALKACTEAEHVCSFVLGHDVPHMHIHVVPGYPGAPREYWGMHIGAWPDAPRGGAQEIAALCERLREYLQREV